MIIDQTGLSGRVNLKLRWTPDLQTSVAADDQVSLFTALQEQLGLKLESSSGTVNVLLIDHVQRPTPD